MQPDITRLTDEERHVEIGEGDIDLFRDSIDCNNPDSGHLRYQLFVPHNFEFHHAGNPGGFKLPGFVNTSTGAATGGTPADGTSWSARLATIRPEHPRSEHYAEGSEMKLWSQVYHLDEDEPHGEHIVWDVGFPRGEWVTIDQFVRLNHPDASNGLLLGWVDGEFALGRSGVKYRDNPDSGIERVWWGIYFGGSWGSPKDQYLRLRDVEIWEDVGSRDVMR